MQKMLALVLGGVMSLGLGGCEALKGLGTMQQPGRGGTGEIRWVSEPTEILDLKGPATARVGQPVELAVQVVVGSSSCNRPGEVRVEVDEASRTVTVRATRLKADADIPCTDDYGWVRKTASFTPGAAGTYRVHAERYKPSGLPPGEQPQGELEIRVEAE